MRTSALVLPCLFIVACAPQTEKVANKHVLSRPDIHVIESTFPLYLDSVLGRETGPMPPTRLNDALQGVVEDFYFEQCAGDSSETFCRLADALLFTVKASGHSSDYYLLVMQNVPQESVIGRLVKWDPEGERIAGVPADVRLFGMYNVRNGKLEASNLKEKFQITGPELELVDTLGREAIIVRRLWHNGTFNSMERSVLCLGQTKVDTLFSLSTPL